MLRWRRNESDPSSALPTAAVVVVAEEEQGCPGLGRTLKRLIEREEQPEVLDLGSDSGPTAMFLAAAGVRVHVEGFVPPPAAAGPGGQDGESGVIRLDQGDARFHMILAWEHPDFVSPRALPDLLAEFARVLRPGGYLAFYAHDNPMREPASPDLCPRYRMLGDERVVRSTPGPQLPRWFHATRRIEQALAPLTVQGIHLQRNRMREFLVQKPQPRES